MKTALKNSKFRSLIPAHFESKGEVSILSEFNEVVTKKSVLFYPSSASDISDLLYVNRNRLIEISECSPTLFIHCDKGLQGIKLEYPDFAGVSNLRFYNKEQLIDLYKFKRTNSNEEKWLIFFGGYYNEVILESLIKNQIKIPVVYAKCDGITSGMGIGYEFSIPTILYPLLNPVLDIRYIITEQGWRSVISRLIARYNYRDVDEFRVYLQNIWKVSNNQSIQEILDLSDDAIREHLFHKLDFEEILINSENKLRCYDDRFSDRMVLKKL